ncbi:hypothetical protein ACEN9X_09435 [Mucilaginibacter sp. Mucisp86]|uniref:hypothetical protein n=1 Tax=Mucilaginibacter sp. Mucisp86 TaxID=3243060 RepID=UPI0039B40F91
MDFKPIRNKIRTFSYHSLTTHLLQILKEQETSERPQAFWHSLTLLKWTLEFAGESYPSKNANKNDVHKLLNSLSDLEMSHRTFNLKTNGGKINKMLTILSVQQLQYQQNAWRHSFASQLILFYDLKHKYDIAKSFKQLTNLDLSVFLEILFIYWLVITQDHLTKMKFDSQLYEDVTNIIVDLYGATIAKDFRKLLTVSQDNAKEIFEEDKRMVRNYDLQIFDTSFFTRYPFFAFDGKIVIPHKDILTPTANYFIYDFMKNRDEHFSTEFGGRMEKYMNLGLKEINASFKTENDLKSILGKDQKVVDFIIDGNILVEAKAIELKPIIGINPTDDNLANEFRKNIVKAYTSQMLDVVETLQLKEEAFGIIVTYKRLYIGNSGDVWNQFLKEETQKLKTAEQIALLPIENLFFIDLHTWDTIVQIIKNNKITLTEILIKVRDTDKIEQQKKFSFEMHLDEYKITNYDLLYLSEAYDRIQVKKDDRFD